MAEQLDEYDFDNRGRPPKYDQYLDGGIYRLIPNVDFAASIGSMRVILHKRAKTLGHAVHVYIEADPPAIVVQAYTKDES